MSSDLKVQSSGESSGGVMPLAKEHDRHVVESHLLRIDCSSENLVMSRGPDQAIGKRQRIGPVIVSARRMAQ